MYEWWATLSDFEKVFWYIAIPFSVILIIQMILTFAGMGGSDTDVGGGDSDVSGLDLEVDSDIDTTDSVDHSSANHDIDPSFNFFTIRNFIAFFTLFGWSGIAAFESGLGKSWAIVIAAIGGLVAMLAVSTLFYFMSKLVDNGGTLIISNALNKIGKVYIPILANNGNIGKVEINVQGSVREMQAMTKGDTDLKTGMPVKVTGISNGNILIVEKI